MEENKINKDPEVIDLRLIIRKIWDKRMQFLKIWGIVFILSCAYILGIPRYYSSDARLSPEMESSGGGALSSIASSFGFDLGNMQTTDAIYPQLYPDLMEDNGFVASLFSIKVVSQDGEINTTYYDYLKKYQKANIWTYPIRWIKRQFKKKPSGKSNKGEFTPYALSEEENNIAESVRSNIMFTFNEKNGIISVKTKAQDALISKILADSVLQHLQDFITEYRTNKARTDYEYYKKLATDAKHEYEKTRQLYASMADASTHVSLRSVELKMEDMENDMQQKFNAYTTMNTQLQAAKAKVQERTPAFTVLKGAAVPLKPAGPKRMLFVLFMLVLSTMAFITYILRHDLLKLIAVKAQ